MGMKLAVLAPMGIDPEIELLQQIIQDVFVRNAEKVKEEGTEIDFHLMHRGFTDIDFFDRTFEDQVIHIGKRDEFGSGLI